MSALVWVAIGATVVVVYPFLAGLLYRGKHPDGPEPSSCSCGFRGSPGDGYYFRCPWHSRRHTAMLAGVFWPLWVLTFVVHRVVRHTVRALAYAPRAMFRLGAGKIGGGA